MKIFLQVFAAATLVVTYSVGILVPDPNYDEAILNVLIGIGALLLAAQVPEGRRGVG